MFEMLLEILRRYDREHARTVDKRYGDVSKTVAIRVSNHGQAYSARVSSKRYKDIPCSHSFKLVMNGPS
jgi:hypothetical protein